MHIETFTLGPLQTNCYVVSAGRACWIVDAGAGPEPMLAYIWREGLEPRQVVLTHAHGDHIAGLELVRETYPKIPILIHEAETEFLQDTSLNLSIILDAPIVAPPATTTLAHGDTLTLGDGGDTTFKIRHTPGHSPGGIVLYRAEENVALVGDTLFAGSVGRHDFPTSDGAALMRSIEQQLMSLPDETRVLPGHGPETTIGAERQSNPFVGQN